ncbi:MAG: hypothetical protein M5U34_24790 [Chloroflexi bacterium]|nr:hypothetical protein [Chloroflexota bacterium]
MTPIILTFLFSPHHQKPLDYSTTRLPDYLTTRLLDYPTKSSICQPIHHFSFRRHTP